MEMTTGRISTIGRGFLAMAAAFALAGCDPVVNIAGANFPAWLLCAIVGGILAAILRPVFAATRLEPYLGPLLVIYPSLAVMLACIVYLMFFNRI
ncbi:MAG TPA: YtcA family lipoprotein [Candidatus Binataceae bacterium]|nr:YtcA family lipoprotein [Candidatus Binataceae bacterium]